MLGGIVVYDLVGEVGNIFILWFEVVWEFGIN